MSTIFLNLNNKFVDYLKYYCHHMDKNPLTIYMPNGVDADGGFVIDRKQIVVQRLKYRVGRVNHPNTLVMCEEHNALRAG